MKKLLFLLVAFLCSSWAANAQDFTALNDDGVELKYQVECDNYLRLLSNHYSGDVVIPETIEYCGMEYVVITIDMEAFSNCVNLTSVTMPNSVEIIEDGWPGSATPFQNCRNLISITLSQNLQYIGSYAFYGCRRLTSIEIPNSVTSINEGAFAECYALESITLSENLESIEGRAFFSCRSLTSINIPNSVMNIGDYAFYGCSGLTSISLPDGFECLNEGVFGECTGLTSINLPSSLNAIGNDAFNGCSGLTNIDIPNNVRYFGSNVFDGCSGLTSINLPNNIPTINDNMFSRCTSLTSFEIPQTVTSIGNNAFAYCSGLNSINIHDNIVSIGEFAFRGCKDLTEITIGSSVSSVGEHAFLENSSIITLKNPGPIAYNFGSDKLFFVPDESVAAYRAAWPDHVSEILGYGTQTNFDVTVSARENSSGVLDMVNCEAGEFDASNKVLSLKVTGTINSYDIMVMRNKMINLRYLDLTDADIVASSYEYYTGYHTEDNILGSNSLAGIGHLIEVKLPNSVKIVAPNAMSGCASIQRLTLGSELETIDTEAFQSLSNLREIVIGNKVKTIGENAFRYCYKLKSVVFGDAIESIGKCAFNYTNLEEVVLGDATETIEEYAFGGLSSLKRLVLGASVKKIGRYAFRNCGLTEIVFSPKLEVIGEYAFNSNSSLESIMLPPSVKRIEDNAFGSCRSLREIRIPESLEFISNMAFYSENIRDIYAWTIQPITIGQNTFHSSAYSSAMLHVPDTAQKLYYWNTQWSQFLNITMFNEPYTYFYLKDKDLLIDNTTARLDGEPDATFQPGSAVIVEGDDSQDLGDVALESNGGDTSASIIGGESATEQSGANVNIANLNIKIEIRANKWYFFAFPFDIEYRNIHFPGQFVWRYYDGDYRAEHGSGAWKNHDGRLVAGRGYIFQANKNGTLTLTVGEASIGADDRMIALESHGNNDTPAQDASWNLIGNPFTSYYNLADMGYNAPVTYWNPNTNSYEAANPMDDDLVFHPFQAFFVQKPDGCDGVGFDADMRETKNQSDDPNHRRAAQRRRMARAAQSMARRSIVNLEVKGLGEGSDRTRIVFNEESKPGYETECDASKFMSTTAPQIYTIDNLNVAYAINERPQADGTVRLGFYAPAAGTYTIEAARMDVEMEIVDMKTGKIGNLAEGYEFTSDKGTDDDRFIVRLKTPTGINEALESDEEATYIGVNGVIYGERRNTPAGVALEKRGTQVNKVVVK